MSGQRLVDSGRDVIRIKHYSVRTDAGVFALDPAAHSTHAFRAWPQ